MTEIPTGNTSDGWSWPQNPVSGRGGGKNMKGYLNGLTNVFLQKELNAMNLGNECIEALVAVALI
jgi:hypothetical protein